MKIITDEMRFRKKLCEFALKNGVTKTARRYHTNRQFIYRQLEKYDGTLRRLTLKSRRPHSHPNAYTAEELGMNHRRIRPYSPWQNGKVERSHKIEGERFYSRNEFTSVED